MSRRSSLVLALLLSACARMQPGGSGDGPASREAATLDRLVPREPAPDHLPDRAGDPLDSLRIDAAAKPDTSRADARIDAAKSDSGTKPDASKPDLLKPDLPKPKPDLPKPDASKAELAIVTNPCGAGASVTQTYAANMVVCKAAVSVNLCGAGGLCNTLLGWSVCSASQFRARGGSTVAAINRAWIKTCIRDGATASPPTDAPCSSCSTSSGSPLDVGWRCGSGSQSDKKNADAIGVASFVDCRRVGENSAATEAMWAPYEAASPLDSALCCL